MFVSFWSDNRCFRIADASSQRSHPEEQNIFTNWWSSQQARRPHRIDWDWIHWLRILSAKKQNLAEEQWNKRKKTSRKTGVYTTEKPPKSIVSMMNTRLLGQNDDANLGKHLSMTHLRYQEKGERREKGESEEREWRSIEDEFFLLRL